MDTELSNSNEPWYGVKTLLRHAKNHFEERIIIVHADSFEAAEEKARIEAKEHVESLDNVELVKVIDVYHIFDEKVGDLSEVYSMITEVEVGEDEYIKTRYEDWDGPAQ